MIDKIDVQKVRELNETATEHLRKRIEELYSNKVRREYFTVTTTCVLSNTSETIHIEVNFPVGFFPFRFPCSLKLSQTSQDKWRDCVVNHIDKFYAQELKMREEHEQAVNNREYKEYQRLKAKFEKTE